MYSKYSRRFKFKRVQHIIQINGGIMVSADMSAKNIIYMKKIIFGILLHVAAKIQNVHQVLLMVQ